MTETRQQILDSLDVKIKIIEMLIEAEDEEKVLFIKSFVKKINTDEKLVRKILKELKRIEMVEVDWCIDQDGMLAGTGFVLTRRATQWSIREWLVELKRIQGEEK